MIGTQPLCEIATNLSRHLEFDRIFIASTKARNPPVSKDDLEQLAGEFITRQVLEKDSVLFEG